MWLVKWQNVLDGRNGSAKFSLEADATAWANNHIAAETWGRRSRLVIDGDEGYDASLIISSEVIDWVDELGTAHTYTRHTLSDEFTYTISEIDVSAETEEAAQERKRIAQEKAKQFAERKKIGETAINYFSQLINDRNLTIEQENTILANTAIAGALQHLSLGKIQAAYAIIQTVVADEVIIYQEDLNKILMYLNDNIQ